MCSPTPGHADERMAAPWVPTAYLWLVVPQNHQWACGGRTLWRAQEWQETVEALEAVGVAPAERDGLVCLLAGILHLGEVDFVARDAHCDVANPDQLAVACTLLGVPCDGSVRPNKLGERPPGAWRREPFGAQLCLG